MLQSRIGSVYRSILALLWATLLALSLSLPSHAQGGDDPAPPRATAHPVRFEHLTTEEGLSSDIVWGIVQDNHGFIWIGTVDGLNRYDGKTFKIYRYDPNDPNSLGNNSVHAWQRIEREIFGLAAREGVSACLTPAPSSSPGTGTTPAIPTA